MNDSQIENLLRRAPQPFPPSGLLEKLQMELALPKPVRTNGDHPRLAQSWLRRWLPAFAFGLIIMSCLVIIGMQANVTNQLKRQNEELRSTTPDLDQLRNDRVKYEQLKIQQDELERLRADNQDLQRLRAEITRLRPLVSEVLRLRAENQRLTATLTVFNRRVFPTVAPEPGGDPEKAASTKCVNNLKQIGLAFKFYALGHQYLFPTALLQVTNELGTPMILFCPSDTAKYPSSVLGWSEFRPDQTSYQLTFSGTNDEVRPSRIISKCPIHGHVGLSDGSVHRIADAVRDGRAREITIDGRQEIEFLQK